MSQKLITKNENFVQNPRLINLNGEIYPQFESPNISDEGAQISKIEILLPYHMHENGPSFERLWQNINHPNIRYKRQSYIFASNFKNAPLPQGQNLHPNLPDNAPEHFGEFICYAPSILAFWALGCLEGQAASAFQGSQTPCLQTPPLQNSCLLKPKINAFICDQATMPNRFAQSLLKWRLKNERRRMGSDVTSPLMTRYLRQYVAIADYFNLSIGQWLTILAHKVALFEQYRDKIYWLKGGNNRNHWEEFITQTHKN